MPELPEVETVSRQLGGQLRGRTIEEAIVYDSKLKVAPATLKNQRIVSVKRRGKLVLFELQRGVKTSFLAIHLRMTGRLIVWPHVKRSKRTETLFFYEQGESNKHLRVRFRLDKGELLFFDPRRFGTVQFYKDRSELPREGADPMSAEFTPELLASLLAKRKQPLKHWLLRQDAICGIGNIYASEILFRAKLSPYRPAGRVKPAEILLFYKSIRNVLEEAIKNCGTTFSDFQDSSGESGSYGRFLRVYSRAGKKCRSCPELIQRKVQSGRSTFYCPQCQKR